MDFVSLFRAFLSSPTVKNNGDEALCYSLFAVCGVFGLRFLSDMKFSAVITVGAAVQCLGFCLLRLKMHKQGGSQGISSRTLQMFLLTYCFRLYSTLQYNGYLPVDRTGDWAYQAIDCVAVCVVLSLIVTIHSKYESTYEKSMDTCAIHWFFVGALLLAVLVHPHLNNRRVPDMCWTAALYMEAVAMVPQLYQMSKKGGEVDSLAGHYVACCFVSRILMLSFWLHSYPELTPKGSSFNLPGYGVVGAQLLQLVLFGDFMWYYVKSVTTEAKLVLPEMSV